MSIRPLVVDYDGLLRIGVPYCKSQIWRLMQPTLTVTRREPGKKGRVAMVIPNPRPFPQSFKLTASPNSPPVWRVKDVLAWLEAHGLAVTNDWFDS